MNCREVRRIIADTAYVRTGGSKEELGCAEYLASRCKSLGLQVHLEPFAVKMYRDVEACLTVDGREIACKGCFGAGNGKVKAGLYYLAGGDSRALKKCKGKIVLIDRGVGYKLYDKLIENGAVGIVTCNGNLHFSNCDIDRREIRFSLDDTARIPWVNIHIKDMFALIKSNAREAELVLLQTCESGTSHNVIVDLDGESEETVVVCAHYDSTELSVGAYDNMTGCIGLLYLAEQLKDIAHTRRVRLLFCGSEERGLLGSIAYCQAHREELSSTILNVNLDMLGSVMGDFNAFSCADEGMVRLLEQCLAKNRYCGSVKYAIRSSDSNSFVYYGVPAVSFARYAPAGAALIHTRYDRAEDVDAKRLLDDMRVVTSFVKMAILDPSFPTDKNISERIAKEVQEYMTRRL